MADEQEPEPEDVEDEDIGWVVTRAARMENALLWIRHLAGLHYLGDAFEPEHMRTLANIAADALGPPPPDGEDVPRALPDFMEVQAEARVEAQRLSHLFNPEASAPRACYQCGKPLDTATAHSYHAEGCPLRDDHALELGPDDCARGHGCGEDVHPECCPTCNPERIRVYDKDGEPSDIVARTKTGKVLTEADIQRLAEEAEAGYDNPEMVPLRERTLTEQRAYQDGFKAGLAWRHENLPLGLDAEVDP
jgi:hypothetical protein